MKVKTIRDREIGQEQLCEGAGEGERKGAGELKAGNGAAIVGEC